MKIKPKTGEIKFLGLGRIAINPINAKKVMKCKTKLDKRVDR